MEITVVLNEKVKPEEINTSNIFYSVTWNQLLPAINDIIRLREDWEVVDGFVVNQNGLKIKLSRKRGRKNK